MNQLPLLSIIVANYNTEKYLRVCLDSILKQSYQPLEIIVYDDCSTDSSINIIREYVEKYPNLPHRVIAIYGKKNLGVAAARHAAILQAQGEYITTLDSDDFFYDSQKLEKEMTLTLQFKTDQNKDILAFSDIMLVDSDGKDTGPLWQPQSMKQGHIFDSILTRSCMIPRDFIMKRDAYFQSGGYNHKLVIFEDWDLKIRLAHQYDFYFTGIIGIAYRRHGSGLSSTPHKKQAAILSKIFKKNLRLVENQHRRVILKQLFTRFLLNQDRPLINQLKNQLKAACEIAFQLGACRILGYLLRSIKNRLLRLIKKK